MSTSQASREMPRYQCHKQVWALKIASTEFGPDGSKIITPADEGFAPFLVDAAYVRKHEPQAGGYYVQYRDGYQSFSTAEAFEQGYTRI